VISIFYSDQVCTIIELFAELKEDFIDNGRIDCLRTPHPARENETHQMALNRIKSAWDSDCAYEGPDSMFDSAKSNYNIEL